MTRRIFVILGLDKHLSRVEVVRRMLCRLYPGCELGYACYLDHTKPRPVELPKLAAETGCPYFRPNYPDLAALGVLHACCYKKPHYCDEVSQHLWIHRHFQSMGYDLVYTIHSDCFPVRDFVSEFEGQCTGNWSWVCPLWRDGNGRPWSELSGYSSWRFCKSRVKLGVTCLLTNPLFVEMVFREYPTLADFSVRVMGKSYLCGDMSLVEVSRDFLGFDGRVVEGVYQEWETLRRSVADDRRACRALVDRVVENERVKLLHGRRIYKHMSFGTTLEKLLGALGGQVSRV